MEDKILKKLRRQKNISAQQVGNQINLSAQSLRRLENNIKKADFQRVKDYLAAIGYSLIIIDSAQLISAQKEAK